MSSADAVGILPEAGNEVSDAEDVVPLLPPQLHQPVGLYPGGGQPRGGKPLGVPGEI